MSYNDLYICIYTKESLAFKKKKKKRSKVSFGIPGHNLMWMIFGIQCIYSKLYDILNELVQTLI